MHKSKKNFHKNLRRKLFDMTTYLNHNRKSFKCEFLDTEVITHYNEWLFSESHVTLVYTTPSGIKEFTVDNSTFDDWLVNIQ